MFLSTVSVERMDTYGSLIFLRYLLVLEHVAVSISNRMIASAVKDLFYQWYLKIWPKVHDRAVRWVQLGTIKSSVNHIIYFLLQEVMFSPLFVCLFVYLSVATRQEVMFSPLFVCLFVCLSVATRQEVMFSPLFVCLFVCLSVVTRQDISKSIAQIFI